MSKTKEYLEEQYTEINFDVDYQEYLYRKSLQDMNQRFEEELEALKKEECKDCINDPQIKTLGQ